MLRLSRPPLPPLLQRLTGFSLFVWRRAMQNRCLQVAASLTFTTLLSLVPLITITLIVVAAFPVFEELSSQFKEFLLRNLVPDFAGRIISVYLKQFTDNAGRLTAVGLALLAFTSLSLMLTIDRTFNAIWQVQRPRKLLHNMLVYWTVLTLGPLLLGVGISGSAWILNWSGLARTAPGLAGIIQNLGSLTLATVMLTVLYGLVPNCYVPRSHALIGGALTALTLGVAQAGFGLYVEISRTYQFIYGAFATFPFLLIWLQLMWLTVLIGAELTASLSYWKGDVWRREGDSQRRFCDALDTLVRLSQAQVHGRALGQADLRHHIDTGYDEIGRILDELAQLGLVQRSTEGLWALLYRPESVSLLRLWHHFVLDLNASPADDAISHSLTELVRPLEAGLDISLAEFLRRYPPAGPAVTRPAAPLPG